MSVVSKDAASGRGPAIFKRANVTKHRPATQRALALLLWLVSMGGSVLWGGGGWQAWAALDVFWVGALLALVLQLVMSWFQITASDRVFSLQYLGALFLSSAATIAGYLPLVFLWLQEGLGVTAWSSWWWGAAVAVVVVAIAVDVVPERTLFEG